MLPLTMLVVAAVASASCGKTADDQMKTSHALVEIGPGKSIGELRLGTHVKDLPARAVVAAPGGELDGIKFVLDEDDKIDDIWVEDLRKFPRRLAYKGAPLDPQASVEQLEPVFGKCTRVEGVKGGIFFNCAAE